MNVLDENIPDSQRQLLRSWKIQVSQIGHEVGRKGMKDEAIVPLFHKLRDVHSSPATSGSIIAAYAILITVWSASR